MLPSSTVKFKPIGISEGLRCFWLRSTQKRHCGTESHPKGNGSWRGHPTQSNVRQSWSWHHGWLGLAESPWLPTMWQQYVWEHKAEPGHCWLRSSRMEHPEPRVTLKKEDHCPQEHLDQCRDLKGQVQHHWRGQENITLYWTRFRKPSLWQQQHPQQLKLNLPAGELARFPSYTSISLWKPNWPFWMKHTWGFFLSYNPKAPRDLLRTFKNMANVQGEAFNSFWFENMKCDRIHAHSYKAWHPSCTKLSLTHFKILPWLAPLGPIYLSIYFNDENCNDGKL